MISDLEIIRAIEQEIGMILKKVTDEIDHNADAYCADAGGHVMRLYLRNHELQRVRRS